MQQLTMEQATLIGGGSIEMEEALVGGGVVGFLGGLAGAAGKGARAGAIGGVKGAIGGAALAGIGYSAVAIYRMVR